MLLRDIHLHTRGGWGVSLPLFLTVTWCMMLPTFTNDTQKRNISVNCDFRVVLCCLWIRNMFLLVAHGHKYYPINILCRCRSVRGFYSWLIISLRKLPLQKKIQMFSDNLLWWLPLNVYVVSSILCWTMYSMNIHTWGVGTLAGLTHWSWNKMDPISQTTFSITLSWMNIVAFWFKFHRKLFTMM